MTKDTPITEGERAAFKDFRHTSIYKRLDHYLEYRANQALSDAVVEAEKGNALKTVAAVRLYGALNTLLDDFDSQFS